LFDEDDYWDNDEDYDSYEESENERSSQGMSCDFSQLLDSAFHKSITGNNRKAKRNIMNNHRTSSDFTLCGRKNNVVFVDRDTSDDGDENVSKVEDLSTKPEMIPVTVPIDEMTTEPGHLEQTYGNKYSEAAIFPRKFVLDITESVRQKLRNVQLTTPDLTSYLIFEEVEDFEKFDVFHPFR
jgi:hypothetical protein